MLLKLQHVDEVRKKNPLKISVSDATVRKQCPSPIYQNNWNSKRDKNVSS